MAALRYYPDFLSEFACKAGACRQTCCRHWEIRLTKAEFLAARSGKSGEEYRALATKHLRRNPNSLGKDDYALLKMRPDGFCSILTEDGLCGWKKLRGEGLCATCNDFPNIYISFLDDEYVFPSLSCEAILESLLNKPTAIVLVSENLLESRGRYHAGIQKAHFCTRPLLELYPQLLRWGLAILQQRNFCLDDRMVLLAHMMSLIDWMERKGRVAELPEAINTFLQMEHLEHMLSECDRFRIGPKAFLTVNGDTLVRFVRHSPYRNYAQRILGGLGIEVTETNEGGRVNLGLKMADSGKYLKRKENLSGFTRQKENFLEHVLVCEYLRSMMPVTEPSAWDNFKFFNLFYALLKGALFGVFESPPGETETIETVLTLHRMIVHNYDAYRETLDYLEAIQHGDLLSMIALAKG